MGQSLGSGAGPPKVDDMEPPAYDVAIKLPTYEEAQQQKLASEQQHSVDPSSRFPMGDPRNYNFMPDYDIILLNAKWDSVYYALQFFYYSFSLV